MTVVSNASPLCYVILIGCADILPKLYGEIHTTQTVLTELRHPDAPESIRTWANPTSLAQGPSGDSSIQSSIGAKDNSPGERRPPRPG